MEILTKYNIGDSAYIIEGINIYKVTIDNINVKVTKSFGEEYIELNYDITAQRMAISILYLHLHLLVKKSYLTVQKKL